MSNLLFDKEELIKKEMTPQEVQESKLMFFINKILHPLGFVLTVEFDDEDSTKDRIYLSRSNIIGWSFSDEDCEANSTFRENIKKNFEDMK